MGKPRFEIVQEDMGGWVRVFLGRGEPAGEVARFLSHGLTDWMRKRPHREQSNLAGQFCPRFSALNCGGGVAFGFGTHIRGRPLPGGAGIRFLEFQQLLKAFVPAFGQYLGTDLQHRFGPPPPVPPRRSAADPGHPAAGSFGSGEFFELDVLDH